MNDVTVRSTAASGTAVRVVCLPYAGAGASAYRPWLPYATENLVPVPVQLAGREEEYSAPFYRSMPEAAADAAERVRRAAGGGPFLIFGHSFGALLAYETARELATTGGPMPLHVVVSGSVSPRRRRPVPMSAVDDDQAVRDLAAMGAVNLEAFEIPELREILLPVLRADVALLNGYAPDPVPLPLPLPLTALRGDRDRRVPEADWRDWSAYTDGPFRAVEFPGGHMYLTEHWAAVWTILEGLV
jgi:surfactin synthase thioesterase subunit